MFTGTPDDPYGGKVWLRADRPGPDPVTTRALTLVTPRVGPGVGQIAAAQSVAAAQPATPLPDDAKQTDLPSGTVHGVFVIALAAPGTEHVRYDTTVVDQRWGTDTPGGPKSRLVIESTFADAAAYNTTFVGYIGGVDVWRASGVRGVGDPVSVAATVAHRSDSQLTLQAPPGDVVRIKPGLLAVTRDGLVGRVVDVSGRQVRVQPVTASGFTMEAHSAISNHPGVVAGTGGSVVFTRDDGRTGDVHRVVVEDPAQLDARTGAVTVGFVTGGAANRMRIRPAAEAGDKVWILVPTRGTG